MAAKLVSKDIGIKKSEFVAKTQGIPRNIPVTSCENRAYS